MTGNGSFNEWKLREQMCEIGRRVYAKGFVAANDGNISFRLSEDRDVCRCAAWPGRVRHDASSPMSGRS